jgi:hypothetical protein
MISTSISPITDQGTAAFPHCPIVDEMHAGINVRFEASGKVRWPQQRDKGKGREVVPTPFPLALQT